MAEQLGTGLCIYVHLGCTYLLGERDSATGWLPVAHGGLVASTHHTGGLEVTASCKLVKPLQQFWQQIYVGLRTQARGKGIFGLSALQGWYYCTGIRPCVCCVHI